MYLADTVAIVRHLRGHPPLGHEAARTLAAVGIDDVPELHDRIVAATASCLGVSILTGDQVIAASHHVQTLW